MSGKNVPQKITKQSPTSTRLFIRKKASREKKESILASDFKSSSRLMTSAADPTRTTPMNARKGAPSVDAPKAWMESSTPERTRNVPTSASTKVEMISET